MHKFFVAVMFFSSVQMACITPIHAADNMQIVAVVVASGQNVADLKLSQNNLSLIYLRKQLFWPKGARIKPVNLRTEHPLRQFFSQKILGSLPKQQVDYWNGLYFNGVLPPHTVDSEEAVIRYVADTKASIGYIDACLVDNRVQTIFWIMPNGNIFTAKPAVLNCAN